MKGIFKCKSDDYDQLPQDLIMSSGLSYPRVHTEKKDMLALARALMAYRQDGFLRLPFCVTLEAQSLGGLVDLGDDKKGPRIRDYCIQGPEDMDKLGRNLDLSREAVVMEVIKEHAGDYDLMLNLTGPITIATSLVEPLMFYKWLRRSPDLALNLIKKIETYTEGLLNRAIEAGCQWISYSDPLGGIDILGPDSYKDISGPASYRILKALNQKKDLLVHVCGKTSYGLEAIGLCKVIHHRSYRGNYSHSLKSFKQDRRGGIVGHRCIKTADQALGPSGLIEVCLL